MVTNVSERIHTLQEIRSIIAILAVAGVVKDTIDLNHAIKAREARDRAWHAHELRVIAEHDQQHQKGKK